MRNLFLVATLAFVLSCSCNDPADAQDKDKQEKPVKKNRLAKEQSPYLRQHQTNPVDWYPWGKEAFEKARKENKPIFLSIGYSTCHWCHVMEHESFENEETAKIMNERFVCIKVDREERPDVDQIYMNFVTALTGSGGWPLSVWLTPERKPFTGGTYFPPVDKFGRKGFPTVCKEIGDLWKNKEEEIRKDADKAVEFLKNRGNFDAAGDLSKDILAESINAFDKHFDDGHGAFWPSGRTNFPQPSMPSYLLRHHARSGNARGLQIVETQLKKMAEGGIYDHIGGGFARYSTDKLWLVPHFEKMLYDNAQLMKLYAETYRISRNEEYARIIRETATYILRDMTDEKGGFYSAEDADSDGVEGKFYVWTKKEIDEILGEDAAAVFSIAYDVSEKGNWSDAHFDTSGMNVLNRKHTDAQISILRKLDEKEVARILKESRKKLFDVREKRVRPGLDDKVLTSWNGLMIGAMAYAGTTLNEPTYVEAAKKAAAFIVDTMWKDGKLAHRYRAGEVGLDGLLEDYAFLTAGLLDLYEATLETRWLLAAKKLNAKSAELFEDKKGAGFWTAQEGKKDLIARFKDVEDGALPSANNVTILNMVRIAEFTSDSTLKEKAERHLKGFGKGLAKSPYAFPNLMIALDWLYGPSRQIVLAGDAKEMQKAANAKFLPATVIVHVDAGKALAPMVEGKTAKDGKPTAYVCENYACKLPTNDLKEFVKQISGEE